MVGVLLGIVAIAVNLFIRVGMIKESYDRLLQEEDYTVDKKRTKPVHSRIAQIYWLGATAIYLAWSFVSNDWGRTWLVWPVAGVLYPVVLALTGMLIKD